MKLREVEMLTPKQLMWSIKLTTPFTPTRDLKTSANWNH